MTDDEMVSALRAKGWRIQPPIDPKTCKHPQARGSGSLSSDGASKSDGYCPDCGASWHQETAGDPNYQPLGLFY